MLSAVSPVFGSVIATRLAQVSVAQARIRRPEMRSRAAGHGCAAAGAALPRAPTAATPSPPASTWRREIPVIFDLRLLLGNPMTLSRRILRLVGGVLAMH